MYIISSHNDTFHIMYLRNWTKNKQGLYHLFRTHITKLPIFFFFLSCVVLGFIVFLSLEHSRSLVLDNNWQSVKRKSILYIKPTWRATLFICKVDFSLYSNCDNNRQSIYLFQSYMLNYFIQFIALWSDWFGEEQCIHSQKWTWGVYCIHERSVENRVQEE